MPTAVQVIDPIRKKGGLRLVASSPTFFPAIEPITIFKILVQGSAFIAWLVRLRGIPRSLRPIWFFLVLSVLVENGAIAMRALLGNNTLLYMIWIPVFITLISYWLWRCIAKRWAGLFIGAAVMIYYTLLITELATEHGSQLLFQRSLLFGYGYITALCAYCLVQLAEEAQGQLWNEPLFWVYLAFFASLGPAIPYLGMLNHLYRVDELKADSLFAIIDLLFLLQFTALAIAGLRLHRQPKAAIDGV